MGQLHRLNSEIEVQQDAPPTYFIHDKRLTIWVVSIGLFWGSFMSFLYSWVHKESMNPSWSSFLKYIFESTFYLISIGIFLTNSDITNRKLLLVLYIPVYENV